MFVNQWECQWEISRTSLTCYNSWYIAHLAPDFSLMMVGFEVYYQIHMQGISLLTLFWIIWNFDLCVWVCICVCMLTNAQAPEEEKESVRYPGAWHTGSCDPPNLSSGNKILDLWRSSKYWITHLSLSWYTTKMLTQFCLIL